MEEITYAQEVILKKIEEKSKEYSHDNEQDFQDLHWDDVYSVYYDNIGI